MLAPKTDWTFRHVVWATLIFVAVGLGFYLVFRFSQVVLLLFVSIFLGTVIKPAAAWLHSHGVNRSLSLILVYLVLFALLIGFFLLLFPLIAEQSGKIITALPDYYKKIREWLVYSSNQFFSYIGLFLPATLPTLKPVQQTGQEALASAEQVLGILMSVGRAIFVALIILLISYYWAMSSSRIIQSLTLLFPTAQRERTRELITAMETKMSAYITGQVILCSAIGFMALILYLIIGLPNALVMAFIAGVLEAVPIVGPTLGAVPASIVALSIDPTKLVWVIAGTIIIQASENYLLVPRIMRRAVGVNPFVSLVSLFAFSSLIGLAGALLAVPIAAMIQLLLDYLVFNRDIKEPEPSFGRDYISRLRYEAQELIGDLRKQARHRKSGTESRVQQVDQLMDEIEAVTTDLDSVLSQDQNLGAS